MEYVMSKKEQDKLLQELVALHPADSAQKLKDIAKQSQKDYEKLIKKLPANIVGEILLHLPDSLKDESYGFLSINKLKDAISDLDSDDATDIVQDIEDYSKTKASKVFASLPSDDKKEIQKLKEYKENEAGAFMQLELFKIRSDKTIKEAIEKFKRFKKQEDVKNIYQVNLLDKKNKFLCALPIDSLILNDIDAKFDDIISDDLQAVKSAHKEGSSTTLDADIITHSVLDTEDIKNVIHMFEKYDLSSVSVVDKEHNIVGRITNDDIMDVVEEVATDNVYQLAGIDKEAEYDDGILKTTQSRGVWLGINLLTAIFASFVISFFDSTLQSYVALAILMPIVASMGGNAGTQSLSVMVRELAVMGVEEQDHKMALYKEIAVSLINGAIFAIVISAIVYFWFDDLALSVVIACSMVITLLMAGFFGALIPIVLTRLNADPAVGSPVVLTTITDVFGFLSFLGLASIFLSH